MPGKQVTASEKNSAVQNVYLRVSENINKQSVPGRVRSLRPSAKEAQSTGLKKNPQISFNNSSRLRYLIHVNLLGTNKMNIQARNRIDHYVSVAISCVLNGGLILAMIHFITAGPEMETDLNTTMMLDAVDQVDIEIPEEEVIREPVEMEDMPDIDINVDFDVNMEQDFTPDVEAVNAPQDTTNVNQLTELLSDIASPVVMAGIMPGRTAMARRAALNRYSGGMGGQTEAAVQRALKWLASVQQSNGGWNKSGTLSGGDNTGYTGLALLTFLSNGQTPSSAEYGATVSRAIRYLVENQQSNGLIWKGGSQVYAHSIATYALAEAYSMTNNMLLREPLIRAIEVMVRHQLPDGGFRGPGSYRYDGDGRSDNSVNAWHVQSLKACLIASQIHGFEVPGLERALNKAMDGMLVMSNQPTANTLTFGYTSSGNHPVVTTAGALALFLSGRHNSREARAALQQINEAHNLPPTWGTATVGNAYGGQINAWYYAIQAVFHSNPDGDAFKRFNRGMAAGLVTNQHPQGYWQCFSERGANQGPVYNTTLAALGLMVYYRYLPTTQADRIQPQPAASPGGAAGDDDIIRITL